MKLTELERLLLCNQYEILARVEPSMKSEYEVILKCLYEGYTYDLEQLLPTFEPELTTAVREEVRNILEMFRALSPGHGVPPYAKFAGFDGNEEGEHYAYARFLLEDRGLWRESKPLDYDYNTHFPVLPDYRAMLSQWLRLDKKQNLTQREVESIVSLAPLQSRMENR